MIPASNLEFMSQEKVGEIYNSFIPCPYNIFNEEFNGGVIGFDTWRRYECFDGIKFFGDKTFCVTDPIEPVAPKIKYLLIF